MTNSTTIIAVIARRYGLAASHITNGTRTKKISRARSIAMYLARTIAKESYPTIAKAFGGKHHTTIMHAVHRVENCPELLAEANEYQPHSFNHEQRDSRSEVLKALECAKKCLQKAQIELDCAWAQINKGNHL